VENTSLGWALNSRDLNKAISFTAKAKLSRLWSNVRTTSQSNYVITYRNTGRGGSSHGDR